MKYKVAVDKMTKSKPSSEATEQAAALEMEREIAVGDRRAAYDGLVQVVNWLIGSFLLLNGGALLAALSQPALPRLLGTLLATFFAFGLLFAVLAAAIGGHVAVSLIDHCDARLGRPTDDERGTTRERLRFGIWACTASIALSFVAFAAGMAVGLTASAIEFETGAVATGKR